MKNAVLTGALLAGLASAAAAQTEYVWVTNRGSSTVAVYNPANPTVAIGSVTIDGSPYGIVGVPASRRVYVSYSQTGTRDGKIAVIDSDSIQLINIVQVVGGDEFRRMSLSRDKSRLYVAGREENNLTGAVWALDIAANPDSPPATFVSEAPGSIGPAEDVTEVPASAVGGTGPGPGKIYYTVPSGAGVLFQHNFVNPPTSGPIPLPASMDLPMGLERSPTDSFVVVGVRENVSPGWWCAQIVTGAADTVSARLIQLITGPERTWDVAIIPGPGPVFTTHILGQSGGNFNIFSRGMDTNGFVVAGAIQSGNLQSVTLPSLRTLALHFLGAANNQLYMGNGNAALGDRAFGLSGNPIPNTGGWNPAPEGGAASHDGPTEFAFMPQPPPPLAENACPKGAVDVVGNLLTVTGKNFFPGAVVRVPSGSGPVTVPTAVMDSGTLLATLDTGLIPNLLSAENDLIVLNPDGQTSRMTWFYAVCGPATTAFPLSFPSLGQGYQMRSVPAYYTKADLRLALEAALGPYNPSVYRVFFYRNGRYVELTELADEDCDLCGGAFWILTRFGGTGTLDALDARSNHTSADIRMIPLRPGWNMVSLPFQNGVQVNMALATVQVSPSADILAGPPADPTPAGILSDFFEYANGAYQPVQTLVAGRGYFVKNIEITGQMQYLRFVTTNVFKPSAAPSSAPSAPSSAETPPPPPGGGLGSGGSSGSGCGFLGAEFLLLGLGARAFHRLRRRRRLAS